ncbi:WD40 repeat domain-containing protein [Lacunimicrobium album]
MRRRQSFLLTFLLLCILHPLAAQDLEKAAEGLNKLGGRKPALPGQLYEPQRIGRPLAFDDWVSSACWLDDSRFALGSFDELRLYTADGKLVKKIKHDAGPVKSLCYDRNTKKLFAGCHQRILVIDPETHKVISKWKGHRGEVNDLTLSADSTQLISISNDQTIRIWDLASGSQIHVIEKLDQPGYSVDISPDGKLLAIGLGDESSSTAPGLVQLWSFETREKIADLTPHKKQTTVVRFTHDGAKLLTGSIDERIHVYDVATHKALGYFAGHPRPVNDLIILNDNDTVISASGGQYKKLFEFKIWRISEGEALGSVEPHEDAVVAIALSPDEKTLVTASHDKTAVIFSLKDMPAP